MRFYGAEYNNIELGFALFNIVVLCSIIYSYLMGVDAIDQSICPEVLGMTKCSIA
jgi:hypothetical protein